jgi:hypothetical protein
MGVENNLDKPQNTPNIFDSFSGKEEKVWCASAEQLKDSDTFNNASAYFDAQQSPFSYGEDIKPFTYEEEQKPGFSYEG